MCRDTLTNPNPKYTQIALSHKYKTKPNTNQRTKGSQIPNRIPNTNCAQTKERDTKQIQKLQRTKREQITKSHNQNQAITNLSHYFKLQPTNIKESNKIKPLFLTPAN